MEILLTFLVFLIAILMIWAEVFIIPGFGIAGVFGAIAFLWAEYMVSKQFEGAMAIVVGSIPIIVVTIILIRGLKSKSWQKMALNDKLDGKTNELPELSIGMTGTAISTLKPSGKAIIDDNVVEVQSLDGFIDENSIIEIVSLKENKIFVTKMNKL